MEEKTQEYELLIIINPEAEQIAPTLIAKIKELIDTKGGVVKNVDDWGKRKLAYPIKKFEFGYYVIFLLTIPAEQISDFERELNLQEEILRYMFVKPEDLSKNKKRRIPGSEDSKTDELKKADPSSEGVIKEDVVKEKEGVANEGL